MKDNLDTSSQQSKHLITMNEKKDLGADSSNSGVSPVVSLTSTDNTPGEQFSAWLQNEGFVFWWARATVEKNSPMFIFEGYGYTLNEVVDRYFAALETQPPTTTTPTATPVAQRREDLVSEASNSDEATVATQSVAAGATEEAPTERLRKEIVDIANRLGDDLTVDGAKELLYELQALCDKN